MARGRLSALTFVFALAVTLVFDPVAVGAAAVAAAVITGRAAGAADAGRSAQYPKLAGEEAEIVGFQAAPDTVTVPEVPVATAFHRLVVVPPMASVPRHVMGVADVVVTFTSVQNPETQSDVIVSANDAVPTGAGVGAGVGVGVGAGAGAGVGVGVGIGMVMPLRFAQ